MTDATVSRLGQINAAGDAKALFLKVYAGEVLTAFETNVLMKDKHLIRMIAHGKSAQFPATWKIGSHYHTPGTEIVGQAVKHNERVISIDDLLISDAFLANIDEAMNHYDVRSIYSTEMGRQLAKTYDQNVARNVILAARNANLFGDTSFDGGAITDALLASSGAAIAEAIFAAAEQLDSKDVPDTDRYAVLDVASYYLVAQNTNAINTQWGGSGSYADGTVKSIAGVPIFKSNNLPQANDSANTDLPTAYRANYSTTKGVVYQKGAAGTVQLLDLAMESEYDIRRQGTLMVAKYAVGHGWLNPACSVELKTA